MAAQLHTEEKVTILFAGDSGDGIQLTGGQFTNTAALYGNDLSTFPDFPAEIRAPIGTLAGVSGFQIHFGSTEINTPGGKCEVLVAMNAAALKKNIYNLKKRGVIIVNTAGFDSRNLKLAHIDEKDNPLTNGSLDDYKLIAIDITKLTRLCLEKSDLGIREKDRSKNMFVLGLVYWMYSRSLDNTILFLEKKFAEAPDLLEANLIALKTGYHYAETTEVFARRYEVEGSDLPSGVYRNISGNQATAIGLVAASQKSDLELFYGTYPITPASDILHELSKHKKFKVKTFQAEDEIASVCSAIGASFGGSLGVTASSGPGIALKAEGIGLAVMLELPLVVLNIQRSGPSTGMPTKTEQADLLQALYGRNGEAPIPVIAPKSPADCFDTIYEACKISIEHMTPVMFLSDGFIANGSEPWSFPKFKKLNNIESQFVSNQKQDYLPYERKKNFVRKWAIPGMKGKEHRVGGLEKENLTGNVSYDPENHAYMTKIRQKKIDKIADVISIQKIDIGPEKGRILVLGWGSTYGAIRTAVKELLSEGHKVSQTHLRHINPFPKNLARLFNRFQKILIPEINNGQLIKIIKAEYLINPVGLNKIKGLPIYASEIKKKLLEMLNGSK